MEVVYPPSQGFLFDDYFTLYCTGYDAVSLCQYMQKSINALSKWADEHGFNFLHLKLLLGDLLDSETRRRPQILL